MNGIMRDFFTVWEIDDDGKKAVVRMSSSRKVKEDQDQLAIEKGIAKNGYISTSWSFVNFVGKAYNQLKKYEIKSGDRITNLNARIQMEPYWSKENEGIAYPRTPRITVFDFELPQQNGVDLDKAPMVAKEEPEVKQEDTTQYPF